MGRDQLARAPDLRPGVASVIVGINDALRAGFDPHRFARAGEHTIGALRSAGAEVLTIRLLPARGVMARLSAGPRPGGVLRAPGRRADT